jgi:G3E family GTPase
MVLSDPFVIMCLAILVVVSLYVARFAQDQQEKNMVRLYRLSALDRRRVATKDLIRAIKGMDDHPDLMRVLNASLKEDLQRIQILDAARSDLDEEIRQAQKLSGKSEAAKGEEMSEERKKRLAANTSFETDREASINRSYINEALATVKRLYNSRKIRADQMTSIASYLAMLSVSVAVNSQLLMGEKALQYGDKIKALGCFRKAEVSLHQGHLSSWERAVKQKEIQKRTKDLLANSVDQKGLLLMAAGG